MTDNFLRPTEYSRNSIPPENFLFHADCSQAVRFIPSKQDVDNRSTRVSREGNKKRDRCKEGSSPLASKFIQFCLTKVHLNRRKIIFSSRKLFLNQRLSDDFVIENKTVSFKKKRKKKKKNVVK